MLQPSVFDELAELLVAVAREEGDRFLLPAAASAATPAPASAAAAPAAADGLDAVTRQVAAGVSAGASEQPPAAGGAARDAGTTAAVAAATTSAAETTALQPAGSASGGEAATGAAAADGGPRPDGGGEPPPGVPMLPCITHQCRALVCTGTAGTLDCIGNAAERILSCQAPRQLQCTNLMCN